MRTISKQNAVKLCEGWHGGQWSALYSYASTGQYVKQYALRYLKEVQECLETEYYLYPRDLTKQETRELNSLKIYFQHEAKNNRIMIEWIKHPIYGYLIPSLSNDVDFKVDSLKLPI